MFFTSGVEYLSIIPLKIPALRRVGNLLSATIISARPLPRPPVRHHRRLSSISSAVPAPLSSAAVLPSPSPSATNATSAMADCVTCRMPVAATESSRAPAMVAMVVVVGRWRFGGMILCDAILFLRQAKPLGKRLPPKQKSQGNPKCKMCIGKFV